MRCHPRGPRGRGTPPRLLASPEAAAVSLAPTWPIQGEFQKKASAAYEAEWRHTMMYVQERLGAGCRSSKEADMRRGAQLPPLFPELARGGEL